MIRLLLLGIAYLISFNSFADCTSYWNVESLGDTQVDSIPLYNLREIPVAHLTNARLRRLVDIKNRLSFAANVKVPLWLCDDSAPQAYASDNPRLIVFSLGMLNLLEWNVDAVASVMAHEVAHVELGHSGAARLERTLGTLNAIISSASKRNEKQLNSNGISAVPININDLKRLARLLYFKFSQEDEQQADNEGIRLMTRVGINPEGAANALLTFVRAFGNVEGGFYDEHPSLKDRVIRSLSYLATNNDAKAVAAQSQLKAVTDQEFSTAAEKFIKSQAWKKLDILTRQWLSHNDDDALAFYYRGIYESAGLLQKAIARKSFYKAVQVAPENANARLELCVALFEEGQKLESTYCFRNIETPENKEAFRTRTFGDNLWVGGEIEPFTPVIVTRDESGVKYVTNIEFAKARHLEIANHWAQ